MHLIFSNNARSTLAGAITNVSTTAVLAAGTGALMPQPIVGQQYFKLSLTDAATGAEQEIVNVTQIIGDTVTIVRAQEGTSARPWLAGDKAEHLCTAGSMAIMAQEDDLLLAAGTYALDTGTANAISVNLSPVPTAAADFIGSPIRVKKIASPNSGATTITINGVFGPYNVINPNGAALANAQLPASSVFTVVFDGTSAYLQSITAPLSVPLGGTGLTTLTANAVLIGNGTSALISAVPSGTLPLISTGGAPAFAPLNMDASTPGGGSPNLSGVLPAANAPVNIIAIYPTPGTFTFTVPSHMWWVYAEVVGSGGGGAGENTGGPYTGGGGGAGGYAAEWCPVTPGTEVTVTIGAPGTGGPVSAGASNGFDGGSCSFGAFVSATGGFGGKSDINSAGGEGGLGSVSINGITQYGGHGGDGDIAGTGAFAGNGGASFFGGGIRAARGGPVSGNAASGSGGGGGYIAGAGADGMPGLVIVRG